MGLGELDALEVLLMLELIAGDADVVFAAVEDSAVVTGSLIMNGALVPPSYTLALKPDNGATDTSEPHEP